MVHHCQYNESKWDRPGPYVPKKKGGQPPVHYDLNKWDYPKCLLDLLNDARVTVVGHTIRSDMTRLHRTFFPEDSVVFNPRIVDVKQFWRRANRVEYDNAVSRTLAAMTTTHLGLFLRKDNSIRCGQWRSMAVMSTEAMNYCILDALVPPLILRYLSDTNNDKAKPVKSRFITRRSVTKKRKRQTTLEETTLTFKESDRMTMSEVEYEDAMTMTMGFEDDEGDNTEQVCSTPPPHRVL